MNALFKVLAHPLRREIIEMLRPGPLASAQIAAPIAESRPIITGHLAMPREAARVDSGRDGTRIHLLGTGGVISAAAGACRSVWVWRADPNRAA